MGPDDWHPNVNNNAYTNVIASLAIHWARYMACMCGRSERTEVCNSHNLISDLPNLLATRLSVKLLQENLASKILLFKNSLNIIEFFIFQVPDEWIQKALYLDLPFDNVKRTHYQHQGYEHSKFLLTCARL